MDCAEKYIEQVGDDGFKKHPIGLGPYRFVSHTPGIELVMEAVDNYWRKVPHVKRLVFKSVPEPATRLALLKTGGVDIAYDLDAQAAEEVKRDAKLRVAFSGGIGSFYLDFIEQWDPKSPWHDPRVRLAANYALDRQALSDAERLGPRHRRAALSLRPSSSRCPSNRIRMIPTRPGVSWPRLPIPTALMLAN